MSTQSPAPLASRRLDSWKEIASHLGRTIRTVQRWEREQALPIHRLHHNKQASVYAFAEELDQWWSQRRIAIETTELRTDSDQTLMDSSDAGVGAPEDPALEVADPPARTTRPGVARHFILLLIAALVVAATAAIGVWFQSADAKLSFDEQESQRLYLRGRDFWNQRTPAAFREALSSFERAIAHDPTNPLAYTGLADTYSLEYAYGIQPKSEALPRARAAAEKALQLRPELAQAHASLSYVLWEEGHRSEALVAAKRAIALDPDYATARHWYALFLQDSGAFVEAIREAQIARQLQPLSPIIGCDLAIMLRNAGRAVEARALLVQLLEAHPTYPQIHVELAELDRGLGRYDLALQSVTAAIRFGDDRPMLVARMGWLQAKNGNPAFARGAARKVKSLQDQGVTVPAEAFTEVMSAAGELDLAYRTIEDGIRLRSSWVLTVGTEELYDAVRRDPRWPEIRARLGELAEQMRKDTPPAFHPSAR